MLFSIKPGFHFVVYYREYIMQHDRRNRVHTQIYTYNITNLNTAQPHKRKERSRLHRIVEVDFATRVTTKWKPCLNNSK